jgi:hypothetical protein
MKTSSLFTIVLFSVSGTAAHADQFSISSSTLYEIQKSVWGWLVLVCGTWVLTTWMKYRVYKKKGGED